VPGLPRRPNAWVIEKLPAGVTDLVSLAVPTPPEPTWAVIAGPTRTHPPPGAAFQACKTPTVEPEDGTTTVMTWVAEPLDRPSGRLPPTTGAGAGAGAGAEEWVEARAVVAAAALVAGATVATGAVAVTVGVAAPSTEPVGVGVDDSDGPAPVDESGVSGLASKARACSPVPAVLLLAVNSGAAAERGAVLVFAMPRTTTAARTTPAIEPPVATNGPRRMGLMLQK
jgi:hypothetical protein